MFLAAKQKLVNKLISQQLAPSFPCQISAAGGITCRAGFNPPKIKQVNRPMIPGRTQQFNKSTTGAAVV
jgi:hypothetical protein